MQAAGQTFQQVPPIALWSGVYPQRQIDNDTLIAGMKKYMEANNLKSGVVNLTQDNMPCIVPNTMIANGGI